MISALFRMEWAVTQDAYERMEDFVTRDPSLAELREKALAARDGEPLKNTRAVTTRDGVATIPVTGPMFRHAGMLEALCGATSYETLRKDFQAALDDSSVRAIVLNIDSPGGEVNGVAELANAIYEARGTKPIVAYIGGMGASAAYWLASAADKIVASPTAVLGSIGVIASYVDETKKDEAAGVKRITIQSSQSPNKNPDPATEDGRAQLQRRIDDLAQVFLDTAAQYRGMEPKALQKNAGNGGVKIGQKAVDAGLADSVGNLEAVLAELATTSQGANMNLKMVALALGLAETATEQECVTKASALATHDREACKFFGDAGRILGGGTADEMIGKLQANAEAAAELAVVRAERASEQAAATQREFRAVLEQALAGGKVTLGQVSAVVPTFLDEAEEKKATEALGKVKEQTAAEIIGALCAAQATTKALTRIKSYLGALAPAVPTPEKEPEMPEKGQLTDESAEERKISEEFARQRAILDAQRKK